MFIGATKKVSKKEEDAANEKFRAFFLKNAVSVEKDILPKYEKLESKVIKLVESKTKWQHWTTSKSSTQYGESWYIKFMDPDFKNFQVRISDHATGFNRGQDINTVMINYKESWIEAKKKISKYLNIK
jgi:hypothetical protein